MCVRPWRRNEIGASTLGWQWGKALDNVDCVQVHASFKTLETLPGTRHPHELSAATIRNRMRTTTAKKEPPTTKICQYPDLTLDSILKGLCLILLFSLLNFRPGKDLLFNSTALYYFPGF